MEQSLRTKEILPGGDHRDADRREEHRRHEVRAAAVVDRRMLAIAVTVARAVPTAHDAIAAARAATPAPPLVLLAGPLPHLVSETGPSR